MIVSAWMRADELPWSRRALRAAAGRGEIVRVRRGRYLPADTHPDILRAARLGCRLDCVSLLRALGVFVLEIDRLHVHAPTGSSRLPPPGPGVVRHWRSGDGSPQAVVADVRDALAQACRCQDPRAAIATLDSACHSGLVDEVALGDVFSRLPKRYRHLRALVDPRSESGPETLMRLILRSLGCAFDVQVAIGGVGRVDFLVDGWLIIECDSQAHHGGWPAQRRDRRRDLEAAALGYTTIRPLAEDIFHRRDEVRELVRRTLASRGAPTPQNRRRTPPTGR